MNEEQVLKTLKRFVDDLVEQGDCDKVHRFLDQVMDLSIEAAERVLVIGTGGVPL